MSIVAQACLTLSDPLGCSLPQLLLSVGFFRATILEWVAIFLLQGIFLTQELNSHLLCLPHCRQILNLLSHCGSPSCWSSNTLATWCEELTRWKRPWCWERLKAGGEGTTEDEMVGWHHRVNGHNFEQALGDDEGQGSLACCMAWGGKESDMTEWLNNDNIDSVSLENFD